MLDGTPLCGAPVLDPGLNLIGHSMPSANLSCYGWLLAFGADTATAVRRLNPRTGRQETCAFTGVAVDADIVGPDFPILRGEGYLLSSPSGAVSALPGCPGQ